MCGKYVYGMYGIQTLGSHRKVKYMKLLVEGGEGRSWLNLCISRLISESKRGYG